jgi:predicted DNA-binding antitoxin AbrB/MazE fold protein
MKIKAIYEHEGEEVELMLKKKISEKTFGLFKLDHDTIEEIIEDTEYRS